MHACLCCLSVWGLFGKILELGQHAVECELSPWQQPSVLLPAFICRVRSAKPSVPRHRPADWSELFKKKKRDLFIYADFCITSPLTLTGLSPQCLCSRPGLDEERENVCVCLCRSNSAQSFESQLTELWQAFKQRRCSVSHIVNGIVVYVSVFVAEQWSLGGRWTVGLYASISGQYNPCYCLIVWPAF